MFEFCEAVYSNEMASHGRFLQYRYSIESGGSVEDIELLSDIINNQVIA
jgi:hypothetical protein